MLEWILLVSDQGAYETPNWTRFIDVSALTSNSRCNLLAHVNAGGHSLLGWLTGSPI